jgi:hypothetical protein
LALLQADLPDLPLLTPSSPTLEAGEFVLAIGTRGQLDLAPETGTIRGIDPHYVSVEFDREIFGFGGGPVLTTSGAFVALVHSSNREDIDRCVRADVIARYLTTLGLGSNTPGNAGPRSGG